MAIIIDRIKLFFGLIGYGLALLGIKILTGFVLFIVGIILIVVVGAIVFLITVPLAIGLFYLFQHLP